MAVRSIAALVLVGGAAVAASGQTPESQARPWEISVTVCGLSFKRTAEWLIADEKTDPRTRECSADLRSRSYDRHMGRNEPVHFWKIAIDVVPKPLDELMAQRDIRREGDRWFVHEVAGGALAYEIRGPGWWGLRVDDMPMRSSAREGGTFESGAVWVAITHTTGRQTAFFVAGSGADDGPLQLLLNTVKFAAR